MTTAVKKYQIKNLDCANCAMKIEREVQAMEGVRFASLNFATATMHLDTDDLGAVEYLIDQIEPGVILAASAEPQVEANPTVRRELFKLGLSIVLLVFGMLAEDWLHTTPFELGVILVFGVAYLLPGWPVIVSAVRQMRRGNWFDEAFLMVIATGGAIAIGEFSEAVVVMLFYQIGEYVQRRSVERSRHSIQALMHIRPDTANLKQGDEIVEVKPELVMVGAQIVVRPGEKVPLDGLILEGRSQLDTSALTGESVPRSAEAGDQVLAGMINQRGLLTVQVTKPFDQSSVAKLLELVQNAASRKAQTEKFITRFAQIYSPIVVVLALGVAFLPPLLTGADLSAWVYRALVLLVISCPCALVISIPLGYFGGIGGASKRGILVKGANYLDVLADVKTVIFDKTGTLTRGVFKVNQIVPHNGWTEADLLRVTAQAEAQSSHPVAQSIIQAYDPHNLTEQEMVDYEELPGLGIRAQVNGYHVLAGNDALLHQENIEHPCAPVAGTVVHVAVDQQYAGHIIISDELKPDAKEAIAALHKSGVQRVVMLTGDHQAAAAQFAAELGIDEFHADLLPEDKVAKMEAIMAAERTGKVAFVGDGINDAPVLARADVGIAMGAMGADAAIDTADVVLMTDAPSKAAEAIHLGRRTRQIVWQNIALAFIIKGLFIGLGVFGLASMWAAVFADVGVTLLAVFNATRVLK